MSSISKALVLGGKRGMLGRCLVQTLEAKGWQVTSISGQDIDYFSAKLSDRLGELIDCHEPDCVFNAVAYTDVEKSEQEPEPATILNRCLPAALARAVKERHVKLVHFSSDYVFDGRKTSPYTIDDTPNPISEYGRSKYEGEQAILNSSLSDYAIIRTAWLFGHGKNTFISKMLELCQLRREASVVFDQIGSPTYVVDLARHALELIESGASGLFHIVNSGQANWSELAGEAVNYLQMECRINPVTTQEFSSKVARPAYSVLDTSSFTRPTGATPRPWPQALREYLMLEYPDMM